MGSTVLPNDDSRRIRRRTGLWILAALLLPTAVIEVRGALTRPFWFDELCTAAVVHLRTPAAMWDGLLRAIDTHPPLFYFATLLGTHVVGNEQLAYRLPALAGFFVVPFCLYLLVERRVGMLGGLVAALVPVVSGFLGYASEARPYALEMGFLALALLAWQRMETSRWAAVPTGVFLTAAVASHYYAVLALSAFFVSEVVRWVRTRELRVGAWLVLVVCTAPLFVALPLMRSVRQLYGADFWAGNSLQAVAASYSNLTTLGAGLTAGLIVALVVAMAAQALPLRRDTTDADPTRTANRVPPEECALAAALLVLPLLTFVAAKVSHGGVLMRYILPTTFGLSIAAGFAVTAVERKVAVAIVAMLALSHGYTSIDRALFVFRGQSTSVYENTLNPPLEQMLRGLPVTDDVVISSGTDYVPLAYYARPELRKRLLTLVDPPAAFKMIGTSTVDLAEQVLQPYLPLNVREFSAYRATRERFLLFSSGTMYDWWPERLSRDGHRVTLRVERGHFRLYEVQLAP